MQHEQDRQQAETAQPGSGDVGAIQAGNVAAEGSIGEAQRRCRTEEGYEQQRVDGPETEQLRRIPGDLENIERDALGGGETGDRGHGKPGSSKRKAVRIKRQQPAPGQGDEGAGSADAEQSDTDGEVGEMVPLDDGEEPQQQYLVSQRGGRDDGDGNERRTPVHCLGTFSRGRR